MDAETRSKLQRGARLLLLWAGNQKILARDLAVTQQAVSQWLQRGVPVLRVLECERRYGIPPWILRPDVYPSPHRRAPRKRRIPLTATFSAAQEPPRGLAHGTDSEP